MKRFQGTSTVGRSCLIGQIPAGSFLPQVSSRDIVAGLFSNTFGVESLDASSSSPPEWVNQSELSSEIAEEDVSSSLITSVDEGGMALIKGRVYGGLSSWGCKICAQ